MDTVSSLYTPVARAHKHELSAVCVLQVTCMLCAPSPNSAAPAFPGECTAHLDVVTSELDYFIYLATCVPVAGFQFSITVDGVLVEEPISGGGGASSGMEVSGGGGNIVGVDLSGATLISAGTFCADGAHYVNHWRVRFLSMKVVLYRHILVSDQAVAGIWSGMARRRSVHH